MTDFNYKHIIWDWNGTLFDDAWLCVEIMNEILHRRAMPPVTLESYQKVFDFPLIDYYRKLGFDFSLEPFSTISTEFILEYERRRTKCCLRPGTLETLEHNLQQGLTQSILSASKQDYLEKAVVEFNIRDMFNAVTGLDNHHAFGKIEIGQRWISETDLDLKEILLVGDTVHDYAVARALGIDCCLIPSGHQDYQRLASCGVKIIESFSELYKSLEP
jgi:phosphoglycolate phosphatase